MKNIKLELRKKQINIHSDYLLFPTPHMHKEIELIYVKKGHAVCYADNKLSEIHEGDIFLCFPNQIHYYINSKLGEYYVIIFSPEILYNIHNVFLDNLPKKHVFNKDIYTELIENLFSQQNVYKDTICAGILNILTPLLLSETSLEPKINTSSTTLQNIIFYCTKNYMNNISLDDVASNLHINKHHISFLLNKKLGTKFSHYINSLRVSRACELMVECERNLAFISEESGFGSIRSFNRVFKEIMNVTPLQYYKQINLKKRE